MNVNKFNAPLKGGDAMQDLMKLTVPDSTTGKFRDASMAFTGAKSPFTGIDLATNRPTLTMTTEAYDREDLAAAFTGIRTSKLPSKCRRPGLSTYHEACEGFYPDKPKATHPAEAPLSPLHVAIALPRLIREESRRRADLRRHMEALLLQLAPFQPETAQ